jgi:glucose/arabinose dehydrogenase
MWRATQTNQRRQVLSIAILLFLTASVTSPARAALAPGFQEVIVFAGLKKPTNVRFAPDGRIFVTEKSGIIKLFRSLSDTSPIIFADLSNNVMDEWDRGLLGIALDPKFPAQPYVYVLYTYDAPPGQTAPVWNDACDDPVGIGCAVTARLSRLELGPAGTMVGAEKVLIENNWCEQFPSHSIGDLAFGPDGALYVSAGDGANFNIEDYGQTGANPCSDQPNRGGALRAQGVLAGNHPMSLEGAILRVDPATGAALPSNPLYGGASADDDRVVAFGLRNPFRFNFRPGTSEIWIADVGWSTTEEVNRIGNASDGVVENFGWPCYEGADEASGYSGLSLCSNLYASLPGSANIGTVTPPFFAYQHGKPPGPACTACDGSSVSGIVFYSGGTYPDTYRNSLFFCDYADRQIWAMQTGNGTDPKPSQIVTMNDNAPDPVSLQVGPGGDVFYVNHGGDTGIGDLRRIVFTANKLPLAKIAADVNSGSAPLTVHFTGAGSSDPDGTPVTYAWDLDGDGQYDDSTAIAPTFVFTKKGIYNVGLRVTDTSGITQSTSVRILVDNTPPQATITTPSATFNWHVGDVITFAGQGTDHEDGMLPPSAMAWSVVLMHCPSDCHPHALQDFPGVSGGTITAPDHDYPSYLQIRLTVTDSTGLTSSSIVAVQPDTVDLTFDTQPSGLGLAVGPISRVSPFMLRVIAGSTQSISASNNQTLDGATYLFTGWSDQGAMSHEIKTGNQAADYTAIFAPVPVHRGQLGVVADPPASTAGCGCELIGGRAAGTRVLAPASLLLILASLRRSRSRPRSRSGARRSSPSPLGFRHRSSR